MNNLLTYSDMGVLTHGISIRQNYLMGNDGVGLPSNPAFNKLFLLK